MSLSKEQVQTLLSLVAASDNDAMDCDGCFNHVAQFVESKLTGRSLCESMKLVEKHIQNCPCCRDEFEALLAAMQSAEA